MNDYPKDAFRRTNLQHIREFILYGGELGDESNESRQARLDKGREPIDNRLKSVFSDEEELEKAESDLSHALATFQDVSVELGMMLGARLLHQLLLSEEGLNAKLQ
jgi:hypothetical protein